MPLKIETFSNAVGGNAFYKAVTHPLAAAPAQQLLKHLKAAKSVAVYDPNNLASAFDAVYPLDGVKIAELFVQDAGHVGRVFHGVSARAVTDIGDMSSGTILIAAFDATATVERLRRVVPKDVVIISFDWLRIPADMAPASRPYLSNLNFATNFAFFRDADGLHTRLVTANYWTAYGSKEGFIWLALFDEGGKILAQWQQNLPAANAPIVLDSKEIRESFGLSPFTGQLFLHVVGAAGHDMVKYALDTYGDSNDVVSCTHDANSWPAERYAGLPAPGDGDEVILWVQNSHPTSIQAGEIGLNLMGNGEIAWFDSEIAPFATRALHVSSLLPKARWPQHIEIRAGKHFVRPRYEVVQKNGRRNIAHPNVEREDLKPDPELPKLKSLLGKGFILPAPILPLDRYASHVLPTPMTTTLEHLPVKLVLYDAEGAVVAERSFGNLARNESIAFQIDELLGNQKLVAGYGHVELLYDFEAGQDADGWMHALFRYTDRKAGHQAETSFGAHVFNTLATYKNEPQSYKGPPPGLTTRLFLRVGAGRARTMCHLIYPASLPWWELSDTALILVSNGGLEIARRKLRIPCGGSRLFYVDEMFTDTERETAGTNAYVVVRDTTCRLFGYHGLVQGESAFSLDHMFGF